MHNNVLAKTSRGQIFQGPGLNKDPFKRLAIQAASELRLVEALLRLLLKQRGGSEYDADRWEAEYRSGGWDFLGDQAESVRHAVVAEWRHRLKKDGAVLEVGCGAGHLCRIMQQTGYSRYLGLDLSATAINAARAKAGNNHTNFMVGDIADLPYGERYDVIILDGVLDYYTTSARNFLQALHQRLHLGGIMIISLTHCNLREGLARLPVWRTIASDYRIIGEVVLHRLPWPITTIKVLTPSRKLSSEYRVNAAPEMAVPSIVALST